MYLSGFKHFIIAGDSGECDRIPGTVWCRQSGSNRSAGADRHHGQHGGGSDILPDHVPEGGAGMKHPMKQKLLWLSICLILAVLLLCPAVVNKGSRDGLLLWFTVVLPALFPFMVFSGVMMKIGATQTIGHCLYPVFLRF